MARRRFANVQFERIVVLPAEGESRGRPMRTTACEVNGIFCLRTGAPWREMAPRSHVMPDMGHGRRCTTVSPVEQDVTSQPWLERLQAELDLKEVILLSQFDINSTSVRAPRRSRFPATPKKTGPQYEDHPETLSTRLRPRGLFLQNPRSDRRAAACQWGGRLGGVQRHEAVCFKPVLDHCRTEDERPDAVRRQRRRGVDSPEVPPPSHRVRHSGAKARGGPGRPPRFGRPRRNVVPLCVGPPQRSRQVATRYDKKASHYNAMLMGLHRPVSAIRFFRQCLGLRPALTRAERRSASVSRLQSPEAIQRRKW